MVSGSINRCSRLFGYARHLRGRDREETAWGLGMTLTSDSLVDCEHHLWELDVALSYALFEKYEIWSSLTVVLWVLFG